MANILDIAKYFLTKVDRLQDEINHLKLQILCYYAQAWHLSIIGRPLCDASFEAWEDGPICRELWDEYKDYGLEPIGYPQGFDAEILSQSERYIVDDVWEIYGPFTAKHLSSLAKKEDPWLEAKGIIDEDLMRKYYLSRRFLNCE